MYAQNTKYNIHIEILIDMNKECDRFACMLKLLYRLYLIII